MEVEMLEVAGLYPAIMGMRNPYDSWDKSDSYYNDNGKLVVGENDLDLARRLINAGGEHRKFLRQIQVWADITLPRYIWQELDTYKFGTKNSCSTMHTIKNNPITIDDFYVGDDPLLMTVWHYEDAVIPMLNKLRDLYYVDKDYRYIKEMKRVLPDAYLQMRTWNTNYEELRNIYHQRKHHKLDEEWKIVLDMIRELPYSDFITSK